MPFNVIVGADLFVKKEVDRAIYSIIQKKDIILVGNANTLSTKSFRLQNEMEKKLKEKGAKSVIYTELNAKNMALLKKTDIIYIMDGDVSELIKLYQNSLFISLIKKHLRKGILIAEKEAAILLSKEVQWYLKYFLRRKEEELFRGLGILEETFYMNYKPEKESINQRLHQIEKEYQIQIKRLRKQDCYFTTSIE